MDDTSPEREIDITLLVCTFNRSKDLRELLETALVQETDSKFDYEVLVIDTNSDDDTKEIVESFISAGHRRLRYSFESKQGKSFALNRGLEEARGRFYAIVDDDFILPPNWTREMMEGFRSHPEVSAVSGKVLPLWQEQPPSWLTVDHWSAIAMADYGDTAFYADSENQICLLACAFRTADVKAVGGYDTQLGVTRDQIGGTEDLDILKKLWAAGHKGIYLPHIWFHHKVSPDRGTKRYHRKWHRGHGAFFAAMHDEEFERSSARFLDVPAHMYKQLVKDVGGVIGSGIRGNADAAFAHEVQLYFFIGFFKKRLKDFRSSGSGSFARDLISLIRFALKRRS